MTEYLKSYMSYIENRLSECKSSSEIEDILKEHRDKIAFMQHERLVHFLVTMMFAIILVIFMAVQFFTESFGLLLLITMIIILTAFYIKHYYFLENTVQKMYVVYDEILKKRNELVREVDSSEENGNSEACL